FCFVLDFIFIGLCSDVCLWFESKPNVLCPRILFFKKIMGENRKVWKYAPFVSYLVSLHWGYEIFCFNDYVPYYSNIILLLLSIHSIIFITAWLRERRLLIKNQEQ
ncbi:MAG: hypothetical protein J5672_03190, partial [Verrucomicrobia bacterium]|nr:hypothetical protein [Verrucomicrobiota bacterium]